MRARTIKKDLQYYKFSAYGFLKNLRFFDPFLLLFLRQAGISYLQIGILFAIRETVHNLMEVPSGFIADIRGRKTSLSFSFTAYIISFLMFYFLENMVAFIPAMAFFGIGEAFRSGTHKAMILQYIRHTGQAEYKTEYYGHTRSWSQIGSAISAIVAGLLIFFTGDYKIVFGASIVPYILNLGMLHTYPSYLNHGGKNKKKNPLTQQDFLRMFRSSSYRRGILNSALFDGVFKAVKDYLQPVIKSFALALPVLTILSGDQRTALVTAFIFSLLFLIASFSSRRANHFENLFSTLGQSINISLAIGAVIILISGLVFQMNWSFITILLFIALYTVQNLRRPLAVSFISNTIPEEIMATGISVESQVKTIITALSSIFFGAAADIFGIGIAITLAGALLLLLYPVVYLKKG